MIDQVLPALVGIHPTTRKVEYVSVNDMRSLVEANSLGLIAVPTTIEACAGSFGEEIDDIFNRFCGAPASVAEHLRGQLERVRALNTALIDAGLTEAQAQAVERLNAARAVPA